MPAIVRRQARGAPAFDTRGLKRAAERMLRELDLERAELSVLLTNDAGIRELNRAHRSKDKPTDVLAFPLDWQDARAEISRQTHAALELTLLGDVVISLDTAERQARARKRELMAEMRLLLAHGVLHLIGHDHATRAQKRVMDCWTRRLVRAAEARRVVNQRRTRKKDRSGGS